LRSLDLTEAAVRVAPNASIISTLLSLERPSFVPPVRGRKRGGWQAVEQHPEQDRQHDYREHLFVMLGPELLDHEREIEHRRDPAGAGPPHEEDKAAAAAALIAACRLALRVGAGLARAAAAAIDLAAIAPAAQGHLQPATGAQKQAGSRFQTALFGSRRRALDAIAPQ
jgi:hypothetical protein